MPTYTYECKKCGESQDEFHGISAKPRIKCNECGGSCRRMIGTGAGIIFKGSGFYETDYKEKSGKPPKSESKSSEKSEKSGKSEKKETKSSSGSKSSTKKTTSSSSKKD